jgi:hypothetical protein
MTVTRFNCPPKSDGHQNRVHRRQSGKLYSTIAISIVYDFLMTLLADLVLLTHFAIAAFLAAGMLLIPIGAYWRWSWVRAQRLRQIHAGLIVLITIEAIFHITCPLTILEALLRRNHAPESFWGDQISKILYWDLPLEFFAILYGCCVVWVLYLWKSIPPMKIP